MSLYSGLLIIQEKSPKRPGPVNENGVISNFVVLEGRVIIFVLGRDKGAAGGRVVIFVLGRDKGATGGRVVIFLLGREKGAGTEGCRGMC